MRFWKLGLGVASAAATLLLTSPAEATIAMQKKAKEAGVEATNCLYCHGEKLPKKDAMTLNDRGKWLVAEKEKKGAKEVDGAWAKDYKEPEKK